jgi:hypothetical protein
MLKALSLLALFLLLSGVTFSQQAFDTDFKTTVERPAYTRTPPQVLFDEAHNNFHAVGGHYKGFTELITNDGYRVTPHKEKFSEAIVERV